jgi:hypothetical protein
LNPSKILKSQPSVAVPLTDSSSLLDSWLGSKDSRIKGSDHCGESGPFAMTDIFQEIHVIQVTEVATTNA